MSLAPVLGARAGMIQARLQQEQIERDREERRMQMIGQSVQQAASAVPQAIGAAGGVYNQIQQQKMAQAKLEADQTYRAQQAQAKAAQQAQENEFARAKAARDGERVQLARDAGIIAQSGEDRALRKDETLKLKTQAFGSAARNRENLMGRARREKRGLGGLSEAEYLKRSQARERMGFGALEDTQPVFNVKSDDRVGVTDQQKAAVIAEDMDRERQVAAEELAASAQRELDLIKAEGDRSLKPAEVTEGAKKMAGFRNHKKIMQLKRDSDTETDPEERIRHDLTSRFRTLQNSVLLPKGASLSLSAGASGPFVSVSMGASTGGLEKGAEIQVAINDIVDKLFNEREKELVRLIDLTNRMNAKSIEGRLTDVDAEFYSGRLIKSFSNEAEFTRTFNDSFFDSARGLSEYYGQVGEGKRWTESYSKDAREAQRMVLDADPSLEPGLDTMPDGDMDVNRTALLPTEGLNDKNAPQLAAKEVLDQVRQDDREGLTPLGVPLDSAVRGIKSAAGEGWKDATSAIGGWLTGDDGAPPPEPLPPTDPDAPEANKAIEDKLKANLAHARRDHTRPGDSTAMAAARNAVAGMTDVAEAERRLETFQRKAAPSQSRTKRRHKRFKSKPGPKVRLGPPTPKTKKEAPRKRPLFRVDPNQ